MRTTFIVVAAAIALACVASIRAEGPPADVTIVAAFPADKGPSPKGWSGPNAVGAVGPDHVAEIDMRGFVVQDKKTGKVLMDVTTHEFWRKVRPAGTLDLQREANDPKMLYDPLSGRWFMTCAGPAKVKSQVYLAVSATSDPTGPWNGVVIPAQIDPGVHIGVDKNGFYFVRYNEGSNMHSAGICYAIPKQDVIAAGGPVLDHMQSFDKLEYPAIPEMDFNPDKAPDAPEVLLNNEFGNTTGNLYMYKITWNGLKASISEKQTIPLSKAYPSPDSGTHLFDAPQPAPGPKLLGHGMRRNRDVFAHGGSVFSCNAVKRALGGRNAILWYEVRVSDGALLQEGLVDDPVCDYLTPSLAVDKDGNVGIGFGRTSPKEFPSACVMVRAAGDPPNTMRSPVVAMKGTTYTRAQSGSVTWGNYSATCIDPSDPSVFWTCQEYSSSTVERQWCTTWVAFKLSAAAKSATGPLRPTDAPANREKP